MVRIQRSPCSSLGSIPGQGILSSLGLPGGWLRGTVQEAQFRSLSQEDLLEKKMATHSSILAWEIPWTKEPGGLQFMGSQRIRHDSD